MELLLRLGLHELVLQLIMIELRRILELDGRHRARVVACRRRLLLRRHLLWRRDWRVQRGTRRQLCPMWSSGTSSTSSKARWSWETMCT